MFFSYADTEPAAPEDIPDHLIHSARQALTSQRPVLFHLNADTSWVLVLSNPRPSQECNGRTHINILIDPWLRGCQSDVFSWFSSQWHTYPSSVPSISSLNKLLGRIQCPGASANNYIDAVIVSHEFTDHCHKDTLLEIDPNVPVFATAKAATLIGSWNHFRTVLEPAAFSPLQRDWRRTSNPVLPEWLGISRIISEGNALYYHSAIMISFSLEPRTGGSVSSAAEAIIYTPHGIQPFDLKCLIESEPPIRTLALMHGLHDVKVSYKQLNLGAHNGLQAQRICHASHWIATHDEIKRARGFIAPILSRKVLTLKDALEAEQKQEANLSNSSADIDFEDVNFADLKAGECMVLN